VPPYNKEVFKKSVLDLLKNKSLAQQLGQNGYKTLKKEFSTARMVNETIAVYKKIKKESLERQKQEV